MFVRQIEIHRFRAFASLDLKPDGHVVVMAEAGGGRSSLLEALSRALDPDASRFRPLSEVDFYGQDTSNSIIIEIALGDLGSELEQEFIDHLEVWDGEAKAVAVKASSPKEGIDKTQAEWVLRLGVRGTWNAERERVDEINYYVKDADPANNVFPAVRRIHLELLGFEMLRMSTGRALDLGERSPFRHLIESSSGGDFAKAVAEYTKAVDVAAGKFSQSAQVSVALEGVVTSLRSLLGLSSQNVGDIFRFGPQGGSKTGLLRSLGLAADFAQGTGFLPLARHGSTVESLLRVSEALASTTAGSNILAIDDFGDGLNPGAAAHFASIIRKASGQVWVSTRMPTVAEVFDPEEIVRLASAPTGSRQAFKGRKPSNRSQIAAAKHWHRNLLPAFTYKAVIILEGPDDFAAWHAMNLRLAREAGESLPAASSISIIHAGTGGSGGYATVMKLGAEAKRLGFTVVGVVDGDKKPETLKYVKDNLGSVDALLRLPDGIAIEAALVKGLSDELIIQGIQEAAAGVGMPPPPNIAALSGKALETSACQAMKSTFLHAAFIDSLPIANLPPIALDALARAKKAALGGETGFVQL